MYTLAVIPYYMEKGKVYGVLVNCQLKKFWNEGICESLANYILTGHECSVNPFIFDKKL
jgi:hypothetical protein